MRTIIFILIFLSFGLCLSAQTNWEVVLRVEVQYDTVGVNEGFLVTYVVENAQNAQIEQPDFDGFQVLGSSESMRTSIVNGKMTSSISYSYTLHPKAIGHYIIPSAKVYVGSDIYMTDDASVVVVEFTNHPSTEQSFGFGNMPSLGFNDQNMNDLFKRQEELMRPYQDMFNMPMDSLLQNPNSMLKQFGLGEDMMQMFKNFEEIFDFKMPPLEKKKPKERIYRL